MALSATDRRAGAAMIANYASTGGTAISTDAEPNSTADVFLDRTPDSPDWGFSAGQRLALAGYRFTASVEATCFGRGSSRAREPAAFVLPLLDRTV